MGKKAPKPRIMINPHTGEAVKVITNELADKLQPKEDSTTATWGLIVRQARCAPARRSGHGGHAGGGEAAIRTVGAVPGMHLQLAQAYGVDVLAVRDKVAEDLERSENAPEEVTMAYQDTPDASKGNAFCWRDWTLQCKWGPNAQQQGGITRSRQIDAMRAAGKEPLFIAGLGSSANHNPLDAARFAIASIQRRARRWRVTSMYATPASRAGASARCADPSRSPSCSGWRT
jgi:hypothetical protein